MDDVNISPNGLSYSFLFEKMVNVSDLSCYLAVMARAMDSHGGQIITEVSPRALRRLLIACTGFQFEEGINTTLQAMVLHPAFQYEDKYPNIALKQRLEYITASSSSSKME